MSGILASALCKDWPGPDGRTVRAVDQLDLEVRPGEVVALLGPNGAGKTTTMRMLVGLDRPTSGHAELAGISVQARPQAARRHLGYLSTTSGLPARLTVREVLDTVGRLQGVPERKAAIWDASERFALSDFLDRRISDLSTGMRQRARLAVATLHQPAVLILDEPTTGLDMIAAEEVLVCVEQAREAGTAVLLSTHQVEEAARVCDRVALLLEGRLAALGSVEALCAQSGVDTLRAAVLQLAQGRRGTRGVGAAPTAREST